MTPQTILIGAAIAYTAIGIWDAYGYVQTAKEMQGRRRIPRGRPMAVGIAIGVILYLFFWPCPRLVSKAIYWMADRLKELRRRLS